MKNKKIILVGGGGHCEAVIDVIELSGDYEIIGIIDVKEKVGSEVLGYKVIGTDEDIKDLKKEVDYAFITIGHIYSAEKRKNIYNLLKVNGFTIPTIISPKSYVSKHAKIGEGTIIMHGAILNAGAVIGRNCIVNSMALIEHDAVVGDFCHISTGAIVNGGVKVGDFTFVGSNAVTKQYIEIPSNSFIKAGSLVK